MTTDEALAELETAIARENAALDWIESRNGHPLAPTNYARLDNGLTVGVLRAPAVLAHRRESAGKGFGAGAGGNSRRNQPEFLSR